MPRFTRAGVSLAYDRAGDGFPVVLHTGGAGDGSMWREGGYVERLSEFGLILYDHRGRGSSERPSGPESHRIGEYVADVRALADDLELPRYGFVGYSFGAAVGFRLAPADPRVSALVALGAVFDPPGIPAPPSVYQEPARSGMPAMIEMVERSEQIQLPGWLRRQFAGTDAEQFRLTMAANADEADPWQDLGRLRIPVALVAGAEEDPDGLQDRMAAEIPDATSVHLPGAGHVGAFLRPDEVVAAARPVLRRAAAAIRSP